MKRHRLRRTWVAAGLTALAVVGLTATQVSVPGAASAAAVKVPPADYQPMPSLPTNVCGDSSPKQVGTNAPLPSDPHGFGFANESILGWQGNYYAPLTYLSGSYFARGVPAHYTAGSTTYCGAMYSFGVYTYGLASGQAPAPGSVQWSEGDGYLPAMTTSFSRGGADVTITNFADAQKVNGSLTELVYTRITIKNTTTGELSVPPGASGANLVTLTSSPDAIPAGGTATDEYVSAVDTFSSTKPLPGPTDLAHVARYDAAYKHMANNWNSMLATAPSLSLPNTELPSTGLAKPGDAISNAYKAAYIYTRMVQTGEAQFSGANNYDWVLNHDAPSILDNRFAVGDFTDAQNLLLTARISEQPNFDENGANWYWDGLWKTPTAWADYLQGTGDTAFVGKYFHDDATGSSPWGPSLYTIMHTYLQQQLNSSTGYLKTSFDNDSTGTWLFDDEAALAGIASYEYIATTLGNTTEASWAAQQYDSLLAATNAGLAANEKASGQNFLPCEVNQPVSADRCATANDANWAGSNLWSQNVWDVFLAGGALDGTLGDPQQTDNLYTVGFGRLAAGTGVPFPSFGAYSGYSVALNTGYASGGLYGSQYRSLPLTSYAWQIQNTTGGPNAWWEANGSAPNPNNPWAGSHAAPQFGAVPYAWPLASQTQTVQQSIAVLGRTQTGSAAKPEFGSTLYVGRGIPDGWIADGQKIALDNLTNSYNVANGHRTTYGVSLATDTVDGARKVTVDLTGKLPTDSVKLQLPSFAAAGVASVVNGSWDPASGTVTVRPHKKEVVVTLGKSAAPTLAAQVDDTPAGSQPVLKAGDSTPVSLTITNPGDASIQADAEITAPSGWTVTGGPSSAVSVAAGASSTIKWNVTAPSSAAGKASLPLTVKYTGADGARGTVSIAPSVVVQRPLPVPAGSTDLALQGATPSASYTSPWENVKAINDGVYPPQSNDTSGNLRWGTWPNPGPQWIELDWAQAVTTDGSALYFFDDGGGVFTPSSWNVQYWTGSAWADVTSPTTYGTAKDTFNQVGFDSVTTTKLRVNLTSTQPVGVLEWIVDSTPTK
jgi:hypothetical protein